MHFIKQKPHLLTIFDSPETWVYSQMTLEQLLPLLQYQGFKKCEIWTFMEYFTTHDKIIYKINNLNDRHYGIQGVPLFCGKLEEILNEYTPTYKEEYKELLINRPKEYRFLHYTDDLLNKNVAAYLKYGIFKNKIAILLE
jgi:hypothetical protein